jgi:hypothetical protein
MIRIAFPDFQFGLPYVQHTWSKRTSYASHSYVSPVVVVYIKEIATILIVL